MPDPTETYQVTKEQLQAIFDALMVKNLRESNWPTLSQLLEDMDIKPIANVDPVKDNNTYKSLYKRVIADLNKALAENLSLSMLVEHLKLTIANPSPVESVIIDLNRLDEIAKLENTSRKSLLHLLETRSGRLYIIEKYPVDGTTSYKWIEPTTDQNDPMFADVDKSTTGAFDMSTAGLETTYIDLKNKQPEPPKLDLKEIERLYEQREDLMATVSNFGGSISLNQEQLYVLRNTPEDHRQHLKYAPQKFK